MSRLQVENSLTTAPSSPPETSARCQAGWCVAHPGSVRPRSRPCRCLFGSKAASPPRSRGRRAPSPRRGTRCRVGTGRPDARPNLFGAGGRAVPEPRPGRRDPGLHVCPCRDDQVLRQVKARFTAGLPHGRGDPACASNRSSASQVPTLAVHLATTHSESRSREARSATILPSQTERVAAQRSSVAGISQSASKSVPSTFFSLFLNNAGRCVKPIPRNSLPPPNAAVSPRSRFHGSKTVPHVLPSLGVVLGRSVPAESALSALIDALSGSAVGVEVVNCAGGVQGVRLYAIQPMYASQPKLPAHLEQRPLHSLCSLPSADGKMCLGRVAARRRIGRVERPVAAGQRRQSAGVMVTTSKRNAVRQIAELDEAFPSTASSRRGRNTGRALVDIRGCSLWRGSSVG